MADEPLPSAIPAARHPAPLAVTMGEPGGVGGEITVKAWAALREGGPVFFAVDDPDRLERLGAPVAVIDKPAGAAGVFRDALPVYSLGGPLKAEPGRADPKFAPDVIGSINLAVDFALFGEASGIVTNPIQKSALFDFGFAYPGHTEFLEVLTKEARTPAGVERGCVMMLAGPQLRTVPATVHQPLAEAIAGLSSRRLIETGRVVFAALQTDFGCARPRLVFSGLNPHAGEGGALGREDEEIVRPAVEALTARGIDAAGPLPADTMFHAEARARYDAAICMYHDQALIPAKTLAFHEAVNVTLGLPIIRTSPDHGTALDIAGKGIARADSLIAAIRLAAEMAARRRSVQ